MGPAIGDILPFAVGIAISPIPIVSVILMLFSNRARANSLAFLVGWFAGITVVTVVVLWVAQAQNLQQSSGEPSNSVSVIKLLLGALLVVGGVRQLRKRPAPGAEAELPKWLQAIDDLAPGKAAALGVLLSAVNPKNLLLIVGAAISVAQAGLPGGEDLVTEIVFVAIACSTVATPIVLYLVLGQRIQPALNSMKQWLSQNNAAIMAVLFFVFAAVLIGKGIGPLID